MTTFPQEIAGLTEADYVSVTDWLLIQQGGRGTPYKKVAVDTLFAGRPVTLADIVDHGTVSAGSVTLSVIPQTVNVLTLGAAIRRRMATIAGRSRMGMLRPAYSRSRSNSPTAGSRG